VTPIQEETVTPTPDAASPPPEDEDHRGRLLSPRDVARMLGGTITARTVLTRRHAWGLPSYKIGRHIRFRETDVQAWITQRHN